MPRRGPIIGVSLDLGGNRAGVDMGPSAFRIAGLAEHLAALGMAVVDEGDLVAPIPEVKTFGDPSKKYIREIARVCERLYKTSLQVFEKGGIPLVLGGDHSLGAGSVAATAEFLRRENRPLGLIWVDAHGGMHVSFDLDVCDPSIAPGVGTPVKGGFNYREAHMFMEMVADSGLLRALDLVEVNPILDDRNMTAILGTELASSALGLRIL